MTPEQASTIRDFTLEQFEQEIQTTSRVLEAVPQDKASYTPGGRGMSAMELTQHIAAVDLYFLTSVVSRNFGKPDETVIAALTDPAAIASMYREKASGLLAQIKGLSGEDLAASTQFYGWQMPLVKLLHFGLVHSIHHRGQLSAMLRPMGAKVPSIYGGSLDEPMEAAAAAASE